jgi:DNA-binding LacI/PurR family transcriptional regulator
VLLVSLHGADPLPADLRRQGVPVVVGGRPTGAGLTYVDVDNRGGGSKAIRHLLELDRHAIATIAGPQDMAAGADRLAGYRESLVTAGRVLDDRFVEVADFTLEGGRAAMQRLLERAPEIDAVFAASDLMALGAMAAIQASGRSIPTDVAVIGFDDSSLAASAMPALTSIRQPIEEMGHEMARLLMEEIRDPGRPPRRVILDTELVNRESTSAVLDESRDT